MGTHTHTHTHVHTHAHMHPHAHTHTHTDISRQKQFQETGWHCQGTTYSTQNVVRIYLIATISLTHI